MVHSRCSIELAKILLDNKWYTTHSLRVLAGNYIKPEVAFRRSIGNHMVSITAKLRDGQRLVILSILLRWYNAKLVKKRKKGKYNEWHVKNREYFEKILKEV